MSQLYHPFANCLITEVTRTSANGSFDWNGSAVVPEGSTSTIFSGEAAAFVSSKTRFNLSAANGPSKTQVVYATVSQAIGDIEPGDEVTVSMAGNTTTYTVKDVDSLDLMHLYKIHFREV